MNLKMAFIYMCNFCRWMNPVSILGTTIARVKIEIDSEYAATRHIGWMIKINRTNIYQ